MQLSIYCVLTARHVSGLHAHLQEQWMLNFFIYTAYGVLHKCNSNQNARYNYPKFGEIVFGGNIQLSRQSFDFYLNLAKCKKNKKTGTTQSGECRSYAAPQPNFLAKTSLRFSVYENTQWYKTAACFSYPSL